MIPIADIQPERGQRPGCVPDADVPAGVYSNNFVSTGSGPFNQKSFDTRIDYSAPHNYQVFGRFSLDYFSLSGMGGLGALGGDGFGPGGLNGSSNVHNYSLASGFTKADRCQVAHRLPLRIFQVQSANGILRRDADAHGHIRVSWTQLRPRYSGSADDRRSLGLLSYRR